MNDLNREWFYAKDIKAILGVTPGQLFQWSRTYGLFKPTVRVVGRQGKDKYSFDDLLAVAIIKELVDLGISLGSIQQSLLFKTSTIQEKLVWGKRKKRDEYEIPTLKAVGDIALHIRKNAHIQLDPIDFSLVIIKAQSPKGKFVLLWKLLPNLMYACDYVIKKDSDEENTQFVMHGTANFMTARKSNIVINLKWVIQELEERTGVKMIISPASEQRNETNSSRSESSELKTETGEKRRMINALDQKVMSAEAKIEELKKIYEIDSK